VSATRETDGRTASSHAELAAGVFGGFCVVALANACAIALLVPLPSAGVPLRLAHHFFDAAETLGLGALAASLAGLASRYLRVPMWARWGVFAVVVALLVRAVLGEYLELQAAHAMGGRVALIVLVNYYVLIAGGLGAAAYVSTWAAPSRRLRYAALFVVAVALTVDQLVLRDDYFGIHGFIALGAALLASGVVAPVFLGGFHRLAARPGGRVALGAVLAFCVFGVAYPPSDAVRCELFRQPVALAPWVLATSLWRPPPLHTPVTVPASPWLRDRSHDPDVAPITPPLFSAPPVIVLLTIDAVRGDLIIGSDNDALFPTLAEMKREGVFFEHASSAATQTPLSLASLMSGLMFSEQRWEDYGAGEDRFPYPAKDLYPRLPALLSQHGVTTVHAYTFPFLAGDFGVTSGFREEKSFGRGHFTASAATMTSFILERLARADKGPLFLYAHFAEPHAPYFRGTGNTDHERYLSAITEADMQVGRVLAYLREHMGRRWALIVSADHGEAFGDHGTFEHSKSLYEELVHVPLIAVSPVFSAHRVHERVGLIDIPSTLADLFGVSAPATFDGQSLVPFLAGGHVELTRPLLVESRLRHAITSSAGFKVIEDTTRKTVEAYDLPADPLETRNLFDADPARVDPLLAELRAFFAARTRHENGYEPPYKP
jgi:Sulfatase